MSIPSTIPAELVTRVYLAQRSLGCEQSRLDGFELARNPVTSIIYDAHFAWNVDPELAADADAFDAALGQGFSGATHRKVVCGSHTEPIVEARLAADGFAVESILQSVLEGPLARPPRKDHGASIRRIGRDEEWASLVELQHRNFTEAAEKNGRAPFEREVAEQMVASWRMKPEMAFWLAHDDVLGDCGYLGSWVGFEGLGMVEYLFTDPQARHRGIAHSLIAHAVDAVRAEGATAVLIGADIEDTPKSMYLDLGFRPVCLVREWLRLASGH